MTPRQWLLMLLVFSSVPAMAGCNLQDWWDLKGTYRIDVGPGSPETSAIGDFQTLRIAVYDLSLKQQGELNPLLFNYEEQPLIIDMVADGRSGNTFTLTQITRPIRPIETVTIHIEVLEAVDSTGKVLPACHPGQPVPSRPCVSTPVNGAYRVEEVLFSPPRGGTVTFVFPLSVQYATGINEYFIQSDPARAKISTEK